MRSPPRPRATERKMLGPASPCGVVVLCLVAACQKTEVPARKFYDQQIQPIFTGFCVGNTSPCHKIDPKTAVALGNLDLSSFDAVQKRRDVLRTYGAYPQPLLLMKALPEDSTMISYGGKLYRSEVRHAGGKTLAPSSDAFFTLKKWLDNGATVNGLAPTAPGRTGVGGCAKLVPDQPDKTAVDRASPAYKAFVADVAPVLSGSCSYSTCHGSPQSDFHLTCGDTDEQRAFNFTRVSNFVAEPPASVEESEFLLRPLAPRAGGVSHTGGVFFASREDAAWKKLRDFARLVQQSPPPAPVRSPGETFFAAEVMPALLRRGCAFEGCHSPNGFNDFRLRPGALGFLSRNALHRNYDTALYEFMSLDSADVRQSRLVKKNIFPASGGISHRGGSLLESPGGDTRSPCPAKYDAAASPSAFCTIKEWHRIERSDHATDVSAMAPGSKLPVAYVSRPPNPDSLIEFDTFRGGADLMLADATLGDNGRVARVDNARRALMPCAALAGRTDLDVRGPEWSHDGARLAFAVRAGEASGLDLWLLDVTAGSCQRLTTDNGRLEGAVRVHNFDPVFAPDGSLVFASTRAGTFSQKRLLPQSDLFRVAPGLDFADIERMTWLSSSELSPAFMQNGQVSFTAEKVTPGFYQLSGRRVNWDGTDYHPLLAQRAQSPDTFGKMRASVDYQQATEIREGLDRDFVMVLSDTDARGAGGALAIFNRSVGPFEAGRDEITFLKSVHLPDPAATGRAGTAGVYRSPFSLPDGEILASYAANVASPAGDTPRYDLVAVDSQTGARRMLLAGGAQSLVEGTLGYKRSSRLLFRNLPQLVFGGRGGTGGDKATMHFPDLPMLATVLGANLRRGRNVAAFDSAAALAVYEVRGPTSNAPGANIVQGVHSERKRLGSAPLERDGSLKVQLPAGKALILEVIDKAGKPLFTMSEEHQLGPGESISPGVPRKFWNAVCAGCHGSVTGQETEVAVTADALTGASVSLSRDQPAKSLR